MKFLLKSLADLGIKIKSRGSFLPITIYPGELKGGKISFPGNISSQYISAILMVAPYASSDIEISLTSDLLSKNYVDLTIQMMGIFGVKVIKKSSRRYMVKAGQRYNPINYKIPGDWSSANYFFAAAAIIPGTVKIKNLELKTKQESDFIFLLQKMGCSISINKNSVSLIGPSSLKGLDIDMSNLPDSAMTLAIVSAFADQDTSIRNISHLKYKESDRINEFTAELKKLNINVIAKKNEIIIKKSKIKKGLIDPHKDHRIAMCFAILGLKIPGIKIMDQSCVNKSFPGFWDILSKVSLKNG